MYCEVQGLTLLSPMWVTCICPCSMESWGSSAAQITQQKDWLSGFYFLTAQSLASNNPSMFLHSIQMALEMAVRVKAGSGVCSVILIFTVYVVSKGHTCHYRKLTIDIIHTCTVSPILQHTCTHIHMHTHSHNNMSGQWNFQAVDNCLTSVQLHEAVARNKRTITQITHRHCQETSPPSWLHCTYAYSGSVQAPTC